VDDWARRQRALVEAGLALASELSLPALLQKIVELACEVSGARYGALGVLGPAGGITEFLTHGVTEAQRRAIGPLPEGKGILGVLIDEAHPLRLRRIADDPRSVGFPSNHPPMTSFLGVPVAVRGSVFGNLYLTEKQGADEFTDDDEEAVVTLAAQAAVAIENARLHAEVQRLAVVEERERIAKELHDDIVQSLFAEGMALQAARGMVADPVAIDARLAQAVDNLDRVIRDLRSYVFGLRPGAAADRQLEQALRDLAESFEEGAAAAIVVDVDPEAASLLAGRASDLIQAAREALSNAVRHSGADRISVRLARSEGTGALTVEDNGTGFDPDAPAGRGQGLGNLRERAAALGGTLSVDAGPGRGTRVSISMPL
jgi:signal transduction histidine kinase